MDWQSKVEDHFKALGFEVDWVWTDQSRLFFLAWKSNEIQVHHVERVWSAKPTRPTAVKDGFIDLLGWLRHLSKWEKNFKGRDIVFKWMTFRELTETERGVLREAGVEPVFFTFEADPSADGGLP